MRAIAPCLVAMLLGLGPVIAAPTDLRSRSVFVEGEDFQPVGDDWKAGKGWADDIYTATSGDAVLGNGGGKGEATKEVVIPEAGAFNVWVRYLKVGAYRGTFGLRIVQGGKPVFDQTPLREGWHYVMALCKDDVVAWTGERAGLYRVAQFTKGTGFFEVRLRPTTDARATEQTHIRVRSVAGLDQIAARVCLDPLGEAVAWEPPDADRR